MFSHLLFSCLEAVDLYSLRGEVALVLSHNISLCSLACVKIAGNEGKLKAGLVFNRLKREIEKLNVVSLKAEISAALQYLEISLEKIGVSKTAVCIAVLSPGVGEVCIYCVKAFLVKYLAKV